MKKLLLLLATLLVLLLYLMVRSPSPPPQTGRVNTRSDNPEAGESAADISDSDRLQSAAGRLKVNITMVYSSEKEDWIRWAAAKFFKRHPTYQLSLIRLSSMEAAAGILSGNLTPDVWSPASRMAVRWLEASWPPEPRYALISRLYGLIGEQLLPLFGMSLLAQDTHDLPIFIEDEPCGFFEGSCGPSNLLMSPLVLLAWECEFAEEKQCRCPKGNMNFSKEHWKKLEECEEKAVNLSGQHWEERSDKMRGLLRLADRQPGLVPLGHTNPSRAISGLLSLYLLAIEYFKTTKALILTQVQDENFKRYLEQWEQGVRDFPRSTVQLTANMFRFGPSRYTVISTYENLALERKIQSMKAPGPFGRLVIGYTRPSVWANHPAVLFKPRFTNTSRSQAMEKLRAAKQWIDFLNEYEQQKMAIQFGFRPVAFEYNVNDPNSLLYRTPSNKELGDTELPRGEVIKWLLDFWHSLQTGQTTLDIAKPGHYQSDSTP